MCILSCVWHVQVERAGTDVTLVSYSRGVHTCLMAADALAELGVSAEVIHIRTLRHVPPMHAYTRVHPHVYGICMACARR